MSDHWEIYFTTVEASPVAVLVDMGIADEAPLEELGELVTLRIMLLNPDEDGLPSEEEDENLDRLEDALQDGLAELDGETDYVGRMTMQGVRIMLYYTSEPAAVEACLRATMQSAPTYQHELQSESDPDWTRYFELLYPSERDQQIIGNTNILESLQQAGDNNDIVREVAHWTYFQDADSRATFQQAALGLGYAILDSRDQATGDNPFSLCISKATAVNFETINEVVLELFDLAETHNGEYTGWETTVQKTP